MSPEKTNQSATRFVPGLLVERDVITKKVNLAIKTLYRSRRETGNRTV